MVSTHSRPKAAGGLPVVTVPYFPFQHTAARRRLDPYTQPQGLRKVVSTHSRPKAAGECKAKRKYLSRVSTHSRPKAAGFDTSEYSLSTLLFQHTAARRRLVEQLAKHGFQTAVSTHSRPKAAGVAVGDDFQTTLRFNTQPPEGGWVYLHHLLKRWLCFNTQPPEGGWDAGSKTGLKLRVSTHSRPKAAGIICGR